MNASTPHLTRPTVVHVKDGFDVYIGRVNTRRRLPESPWANRTPFMVGTRPTFAQRVISVDAYRLWIRQSDEPRAIELRSRLRELSGKRLGCWCKRDGPEDPTPCHGDPLAELVAEWTPTDEAQAREAWLAVRLDAGDGAS